MGTDFITGKSMVSYWQPRSQLTIYHINKTNPDVENLSL